MDQVVISFVLATPPKMGSEPSGDPTIGSFSGTPEPGNKATQQTSSKSGYCNSTSIHEAGIFWRMI